MLQLGTLLEPEAALAAGLVDEVCKGAGVRVQS
jgi:hypothetical protein